MGRPRAAGAASPAPPIPTTPGTPATPGAAVPGPTPPAQSSSSTELPVVSFQKLETEYNAKPSGVTNIAHAKRYGYNTDNEPPFVRPEHYIRHIEPLDHDLERQVEYDMDEQDKAWLDLINAERAKQSVAYVSCEVFEVIMDRLEKDWFKLTKSLPKSQFSMPSEDSTCAVCDDPEGENSNAIVFCDGCNLAVHQDCYGIPYIPEGQWLCRKCTVSPENPVSCILCPNEGGAFKQTPSGKWAHLLCAIWIPETCALNQTFMEPIIGVEGIEKKRWRLKCSICNSKGHGACIQCNTRQCSLAFHATCARKQRLLLPMKSPANGNEEGRLEAYCEKHLPKKYAEAREIALRIAEEQESDAEEGGKKSQLAYSKTYQPPAPLVPAWLSDRVLLYIEQERISKKAELVYQICRYWSLKREARRGAPLLKRLHLEPWTTNGGNSSASGSANAKKSDEEKRLRFDMLATLRNDLLKLRELATLTLAREELKRDQVRVVKRVLDCTLFAREIELRKVFKEISDLDKNEHFKDPVSKEDVKDYYDHIKNPMCWSWIDEKFQKHEYWDVDALEADVRLVISNAQVYNQKHTVFYKNAVRIEEKAEPIFLRLRKTFPNPSILEERERADREAHMNGVGDAREESSVFASDAEAEEAEALAMQVDTDTDATTTPAPEDDLLERVGDLEPPVQLHPHPVIVEPLDIPMHTEPAIDLDIPPVPIPIPTPKDETPAPVPSVATRESSESAMRIDTPADADEGDRKPLRLGDMEPLMHSLSLLTDIEAIQDAIPIELGDAATPLESLFRFEMPIFKPEPTPPPPSAVPDAAAAGESKKGNKKRKTASNKSVRERAEMERKGMLRAQRKEEKQRQEEQKAEERKLHKEELARQKEEQKKKDEEEKEAKRERNRERQKELRIVNAEMKAAAEKHQAEPALQRAKPGDSPAVVDDSELTEKSTFLLFETGWILPEDAKRGGRGQRGTSTGVASSSQAPATSRASASASRSGDAPSSPPPGPPPKKKRKVTKEVPKEIPAEDHDTVTPTVPTVPTVESTTTVAVTKTTTIPAPKSTVATTATTTPTATTSTTTKRKSTTTAAPPPPPAPSVTSAATKKRKSSTTSVPPPPPPPPAPVDADDELPFDPATFQYSAYGTRRQTRMEVAAITGSASISSSATRERARDESGFTISGNGQKTRVITEAGGQLVLEELDTPATRKAKAMKRRLQRIGETQAVVESVAPDNAGDDDEHRVASVPAESELSEPESEPHNDAEPPPQEAVEEAFEPPEPIQQVKKRRGRQKGYKVIKNPKPLDALGGDAVESESITAPPVSTTKGRRGRPRKVSLPDDAEPPHETLSAPVDSHHPENDDEAEYAPTKSNTASTSRGRRSRTRKVSGTTTGVSEAESHHDDREYEPESGVGPSTASVANTTKRRGRPPKYPKPPPTPGADDSEPVFVAAQPPSDDAPQDPNPEEEVVEPEEPTVKRARGRPRKDPNAPLDVPVDPPLSSKRKTRPPVHADGTLASTEAALKLKRPSIRKKKKKVEVQREQEEQEEETVQDQNAANEPVETQAGTKPRQSSRGGGGGSKSSEYQALVARGKLEPNDVLNCTLVWAKKSPWPWFPAETYIPDKNDPEIPKHVLDTFFNASAKTKAKLYLVKFFDNSGSWATVNLEQMLGMTTDDVLDEDLLKGKASVVQRWTHYKNNKTKPEQIKKAFYRAVNALPQDEDDDEEEEEGGGEGKEKETDNEEEGEKGFSGADADAAGDGEELGQNEQGEDDDGHFVPNPDVAADSGEESSDSDMDESDEEEG